MGSAFPDSARKNIQAYIDAGKIPYEMLSNSQRQIFAPPPTQQQKQATQQAAYKAAQEYEHMQNFDPEVSDPSLRYRADNPIMVDNYTPPPAPEPEFYSPEGGYIAPASGGEPLWQQGDAAKVAFQALKVPYNLGFGGGPETDVFTEPTPAPAFTKQDMQQYQESMAPVSPLGKGLGWGAEQAALLPFYATAELAAGAPLAAAAGKGLSWLGRVAPKLTPAIEKAAPYVQTFASGFGSGAPVGAMEAYGAGEPLPDVAKAGLTSGLTFGGFNVGLKGAGSLIKGGLNRAAGLPGIEAPGFGKQAASPAELPIMNTIAPKVSGEVKPSSVLFQKVKDDGGFTYDPVHEKLRTEGVAVSPYPEHERIITSQDFTPEHIEQYLNDKIEVLKNPDHNIGVWHNEADGNVYLDISIVSLDKGKAVELGLKHNQLSAYDIGKGEEIHVQSAEQRAARQVQASTFVRNDTGQLNAGTNKGIFTSDIPKTPTNKGFTNEQINKVPPAETAGGFSMPNSNLTREGSISAPTGGIPRPAAKTGPAIWRNNGVDTPVTVTGEAGRDKFGRQYVRVEESNTAVLLDETRQSADNGLMGEGSISAAKNTLPGQTERGVMTNIRTDLNRPEVLRDSIAARTETYDPLANTETLRKAQEIFGDGSDAALESAVSQLGPMMDKLSPEAAPLVKLIADKLVAQGNIPRARELLSDAALRATQSGQFGQAFRILRNSDPATFLMTMDKQIVKLNEEGLQRYGDKWNDASLTQSELDQIAALSQGDSKAFSDTMEQIQLRLADEMPADAMEKLMAFRHMSMLLNVKTQVRNVLGNVFMQAMRRVAKQVDATIQGVFLKPEDRTQVWNIKREYQELADAHYDANKKELLAGGNKYNEDLKLSGLQRDKRVFETNALEATRKFTYKLLDMGDTPFFRMSYTNRLASYAQAKGITDFSKLPQAAFATAKKEALETTYKDFSKFADYINKVKHPSPNPTTGKISLGAKIMGWAVDAALPFVKTPVNVVRRGGQYSPYGIANGLAMWKGNPKLAADGIEEMAKGLTGTAIVGLGYYLAKLQMFGSPVLTGKAAKDADLKAWNANTGQSPFSILGKYTYDWAQPLSVPLSIGVAIYEALKDDPNKTAQMETALQRGMGEKILDASWAAAGAVYDGAAAYGDTVLNMSVMKGIKQFIANPQGYMAGFVELPFDYAGQFMPTAAGQIAGMIDPTVRQSYVPGDPVKSFVATTMSKIPGVSKMLPAKQTPLGQDMTRSQNAGVRAFSQILSPGIVAVNQNIDPKINAELKRLNVDSGMKTQFPTMTPNYIEGVTTKPAHPRINLTADEATAYQKRTGQLTEESFNKLLNSGAYQNAKADKAKMKSVDEVKADMMAKAIADAKAKAKAEIVKGKGYR